MMTVVNLSPNPWPVTDYSSPEKYLGMLDDIQLFVGVALSTVTERFRDGGLLESVLHLRTAYLQLEAIPDSEGRHRLPLTFESDATDIGRDGILDALKGIIRILEQTRKELHEVAITGDRDGIAAWIRTTGRERLWGAGVLIGDLLRQGNVLRCLDRANKLATATS